MWRGTLATLTRAMAPARRSSITTQDPISILRVSQMNAQLGPGYHFGLVGQLSLGLAVFNLLPIPVLDGGHLALLLVEVCSGLFWRRRLGPDWKAVTA